MEQQEGMVGHLSLTAGAADTIQSRCLQRCVEANEHQEGRASQPPSRGVRNLPSRKQAIPATKSLLMHVGMWCGGTSFRFPEALLGSQTVLSVRISCSSQKPVKLHRRLPQNSSYGINTYPHPHRVSLSLNLVFLVNQPKNID